jgi:NADH:ubiquinone oxidoreductase subunit E
MSEIGPPESIQSAEIDYMELDKIIEDDFDNDKENLIMILQAIQKRYNYLPLPALKYLSTSLDVPFSHIYSVATFYSTFSLEPRGRNIVSICLGTACLVRGGAKVHERLQESLNICDGETTKDQGFTLESIRCVGGCSLGPMIKINEDLHGRLSPDQLEKILDRYK